MLRIISLTHDQNDREIFHEAIQKWSGCDLFLIAIIPRMNGFCAGELTGK